MCVSKNWIAFSRLGYKVLTFISSTKEGNPPIDMNVTNPKTNDAHAPLACFIAVEHTAQMRSTCLHLLQINKLKSFNYVVVLLLKCKRVDF